MSFQLSDLKRFKSLFEHLTELHADLGILRTDRADIIVRKILKFRSRFYPPVGFPAFLIIHIGTHGAEISRWAPLFKSPFTDLSFSLVPADRTDVRVGKILKSGSRRDAIVRFPAVR